MHTAGISLEITQVTHSDTSRRTSSSSLAATRSSRSRLTARRGHNRHSGGRFHARRRRPRSELWTCLFGLLSMDLCLLDL